MRPYGAVSSSSYCAVSPVVCYTLCFPVHTLRDIITNGELFSFSWQSLRDQNILIDLFDPVLRVVKVAKVQRRKTGWLCETNVAMSLYNINRHTNIHTMQTHTHTVHTPCFHTCTHFHLLYATAVCEHRFSCRIALEVMFGAMVWC